MAGGELNGSVLCMGQTDNCIRTLIQYRNSTLRVDMKRIKKNLENKNKHERASSNYVEHSLYFYNFEYEAILLMEHYLQCHVAEIISRESSFVNSIDN